MLGPVLVTVVPARTANFPADPRSTVLCGWAVAAGQRVNPYGPSQRLFLVTFIVVSIWTFIVVSIWTFIVVSIWTFIVVSLWIFIALSILGGWYCNSVGKECNPGFF